VLDRFWEAADARRLGIDAIEVVADDGPGGERRRIGDIRRDVFSVSKTVTSLAVGMLEGDGALSLDDPVLAHLPELADTAAAGSERITVGHLLRMTAGNGYRWPDEDADHPGDPARDFLAAPLVAEPGFALGAVGLQLRTSEITRIAQLLLHEGTCGRRRLVPGDYIARMTADTTDTGRAEPDNRTYGLHVWLCARDGAWRMDGIYGQFGIVLPGHRACVSVMAHYLGPTTRILDCVWEHIVPALA
jgi:CubicO group peptidase (beta-lactamase class C family)